MGGGGIPQPGEISLAHNGVLFLDELPEFKRTVLEVLRQPLEDRVVSISRAKMTVEYPASFMLVAAMNPCPWGYYNHPKVECQCGSGNVQKYINKISGPLFDQIDIHVEVIPVPFRELSDARPSEKSETVHPKNLAEAIHIANGSPAWSVICLNDHRLINRSAITNPAKITEAMPFSVKKAMLTLEMSWGLTIRC